MKSNWWFCLAVFILVVAFECAPGSEPPNLRRGLGKSGDGTRDVLVRLLERALKPVGGCGRLYALGKCGENGGEGIRFPKLELQAAANGKTGVEAIQDILRKDKGVSVTKGRTGMAEIRIGSVSSDFLKTKIARITLDPVERYNVWEALSAILQAKEVEISARRMGMEPATTIVLHHISEPAPGSPHLPTSMKDVTLDEALNRVAETFGGLILYRECVRKNGTRLFSVTFEGDE